MRQILRKFLVLQGPGVVTQNEFHLIHLIHSKRRSLLLTPVGRDRLARLGVTPTVFVVLDR
jgi:hypothetical protein